VYLTGALELRRGPVASPIDLAAAGGMLRYMPVERFFDSMAARIDGEKAAEADMTVNFTFTDLDQTYVLRVRNGVLNYRRGEADPAADATMRLTRDLWLRLVIGEAGLREMIFSDDLEVTGSRMTLLSFFSLLDDPKGTFNIVTP
jgi:alkyl sulfatase BDS1-like metallo-beta-lactamase superfamily hydrolase